MIEGIFSPDKPSERELADRVSKFVFEASKRQKNTMRELCQKPVRSDGFVKSLLYHAMNLANWSQKIGR